MDNWSRGWRKLVEWDSINKVYLYKGYKIIPLSYSDQIKLPNHLQNEYYWGEIRHIDNVLKNKNNKKINELDILIRTILIYLLARNFRNKYAFA